MWFTETPWPPMAILLFVGLLLFGIGWRTQQMKWMGGVVLCLGLAIVVWMVERSILLPSEVVEAHLSEMVAAFQRNDEPGTVQHLSAGLDAVPLVLLAKMSLNKVDLDERYRLTDMQVTMLANDTAARSHFRVNGGISIKSQGKLGSKPFRFMGYWRLEQGAWKLHKIEDLDPISGKVLNRFGVL